MEWPNEAYATALFPSLETTTESQIPALPTEEPVWQIFAEGKERNLKHQSDPVLAHESANHLNNNQQYAP